MFGFASEPLDADTAVVHRRNRPAALKRKPRVWGTPLQQYYALVGFGKHEIEFIQMLAIGDVDHHFA